MTSQGEEPVSRKREAIRAEVDRRLRAAQEQAEDMRLQAAERQPVRAVSTDEHVAATVDVSGFLQQVQFSAHIGQLSAEELRSSVLEAIGLAQQELFQQGPDLGALQAELQDTSVLDAIRDLLPEQRRP